MDTTTELHKIIEELERGKLKLEEITNRIYELIDDITAAEAKLIAKEHQKWMDEE